MEQLVERPAGQIRFVLERDRANRRGGPVPAESSLYRELQDRLGGRPS